MKSAKPDAATLERAVRLSLIPGVTLAEVCRRTGVPLAALRRARKERSVRLDRDDLLLAALTKNGEQLEGDIGSTSSIAAWLDYVNHDGSTAEEVERDLTRLAAAGRIVLHAGRFRLVGSWP